MTKKAQAVELAASMAADPAHGYDQSRRWGPDYDCSSFLITVWESVGVPVKSSGASYTGNMLGVFLRCGFTDVTDSTGAGRDMAALEPGDILINYVRHTAMYIGGGQVVEASVNERGGVSGGQSGDQTGQEIRVRGWYVYSSGWDCVLRYTAEEGEEIEAPSSAGSVPPGKEARPLRVLPELSFGASGIFVEVMQRRLIAMGYDLPQWGADGDFGVETEMSLRCLQYDLGLEVDGVCGEQSWGAILDGGAKHD